MAHALVAKLMLDEPVGVENDPSAGADNKSRTSNVLLNENMVFVSLGNVL